MREFARWIETHDEHAAAHLRLLEKAEAALETHTGPTATGVLDPPLADRLERWRYHLLDHSAGSLDATGQRLADALDEAARRLAGGPHADRTLGPRWPRRALAADSVQNLVDRWLGTEAARRELVEKAAELTIAHHSAIDESGARRRTMFLYAPLYLSNYCVNFCDYCFFRYPQPLERSHLCLDEVLEQAEILRERGMHHLLLVAGDYPKLITTDYLAQIIAALTARDFSVAVEIAPQSTLSYMRLVQAGACGVTLYQETYDPRLYARHHSRGTKASFDWRLEGLDRAAEAGMRHLGLGALLGLGDPVAELGSLIRHGAYLRERFPHVRLGFGLPRLHEVPDAYQPSPSDPRRAANGPAGRTVACGDEAAARRGPRSIDDRMFGLFYCLLRVAFPDAQLVLSTRESESLRRQLIGQCITQISAGSSTSPGGYTKSEGQRRASEQFPISDERSPAEVARQLEADGFLVQWRLPTARDLQETLRGNS